MYKVTVQEAMYTRPYVMSIDFNGLKMCPEVSSFQRMLCTGFNGVGGLKMCPY